jgi:hypothetical protein
VLVPVEVSDLLNRTVSGLEKSNFRVFDEKVEQAIVSFAMEDDPIAIGLVFDASGSMGEELRESRLAAREFFKTANPGDEFCLVTFDSTPRLVVPVTEDPREIDYQLMFTKSRGSTALIDAIYLALNQMKKSRKSRKALIVISDGGENNSRFTPSELQSFVRESDVLIYTIGVFGNGEGAAYDRHSLLGGSDFLRDGRPRLPRLGHAIALFRPEDHYGSAKSLRARLLTNGSHARRALSPCGGEARAAARASGQTERSLARWLLRTAAMKVIRRRSIRERLNSPAREVWRSPALARRVQRRLA